MDDPSDTRPATSSGRRYARSREGCLTCKRRKVKCDEQRPRCSHCERLNMECKWRLQLRSAATPRRTSSSSAQVVETTRPPPPSSSSSQAPHNQTQSPVTDISPAASGTQHPLHAVDEVFDYASFMWDGGDFWRQVSPEMRADVGLSTSILSTDPQMGFPSRAVPRQPSSPPEAILPRNGTTASTAATDDSPGMPVTNFSSQDLFDFFATSPNPPILEQVETQKKWFSMRRLVVDMARQSPLVRSAILAFSAVLISRRKGAMVVSDRNHHDDALAEVATYDAVPLVRHSSERESLLAALFFLSYVDMLETRLGAGHSQFERAYNIFQNGDKKSFSPVEKQFLMWIRLLDGKAVSAGGEGLFLSEDDELVLVEASPTSLEGGEVSTSVEDGHKNESADGGDIEDVLFQVLYQPGVVFYQKVQSFMGRISKIDPWHRSRGTVEDEIEVMNIGSSIAADLRTLYDQRPPLMDYAVAGKLVEPHISANLAFIITRAFRTYLANYYASKVHLHRVAYKTLPLTNEAIDALANIRRLTRQMIDDLRPDDSPPVNMLWPLLMLGVEEQDQAEKEWIKAQILRMERVAGNARITAQVLEEVQARQDAAKARMDIRSVMMAVFNSSFAIL
ncbi:Fungal Zn(2)-Cys(6) binuclear cluster domain [Geosmithia morbida]|uniref:Fungal Zn(2)-Cys(6) binuclear cluster domain n=1 Tax=Geosmithia morbida TaxID=1094350 RepID=A0A9P5D0R2_9HYPO|nr:Fungal Zn(2)-Cys(6) binuclear cluster domain [Geosmithia morbida]KAF4121907.1 Fungal Zn(2)-Cys(6) binuclear cluster domain [Geosmithia morbida]